MESLQSFVDAIIPASGRGMALVLLLGIACMALLFVCIGKRNDKLIAETQAKKSARKTHNQPAGR